MSKTQIVWVARDKDNKDEQEYTICKMVPVFKLGCYFNFNPDDLGDSFGHDMAELLGLTLEEGQCKRFEITVRRMV